VRGRGSVRIPVRRTGPVTVIVKARNLAGPPPIKRVELTLVQGGTR
jgi:hypothetical protein